MLVCNFATQRSCRDTGMLLPERRDFESVEPHVSCENKCERILEAVNPKSRLVESCGENCVRALLFL